MVTIEQKLLLFSKLINNSMDKSLNEELKELEKQYDLKIKKNMEETDHMAKSIEERAEKKAEMKRTESLSRSKVIIKREIIVLKEKYYYTFMEAFKNRLSEFVESEMYKTYLSGLISTVEKLINSYEECSVVISMRESDKNKYSEFIEQELKKSKSCKSVEFKSTNDIMGGFIAVVDDKDIKIDLSVDAVLEENKMYIMQTIFEALEAGDLND
ncbi:MAG: V-type ATP synthase subunit E family protein [Sedimentibacter sp.]|uniref:V-type ATP synthase subunit E n=1 Tax=Sedimentibacter sp. TaxID=1960295 RepID=UPI00315930FA